MASIGTTSRRCSGAWRASDSGTGGNGFAQTGRPRTRSSRNACERAPCTVLSDSSSDPFVALDLGAVHDPARVRIERVAPMQHREIVPHQEVADPPLVTHGEPRLGGV